ncbi:nuclear transport factor 2 family protein [Rossellomorea sp. NS-SX7]|uniref:nuclear transport factor 2 family protein n=1 Tax=Rossellomorea sp. NS-SX7 TaxID=3463856 RepID=UPI004058CA7B
MSERQINSTLSMKEKAVSFLEMVASGSVRGAFRKYTSSDFCHHNPYFRGDAESIMIAMEENAQETPDKIFEVKHAVEEGEIVAVHSHVRQHPGDIGAVVVHLFRFQDDLIVEMWDVGQPIPEGSPNENGIF